MAEGPRFEEGEARRLAGLRRRFRYSEGPEGLPALWRAFGPRLPWPKQVGEAAYGVMCGADDRAQSFEYMAAVEVSGFEALPEDSGRMLLPAARYAVFAHAGPVAAIRQTWDRAFAWMEAEGLAHAPTPSFERYGPAYDPQAGEGDMEICLAVDRRS